MLIAVVNKSTRITHDEAAAMTAACNAQLAQHVAPLWRAWPATVMLCASEATVPANASPVYLFNTPDQPNAEGWHSEDSHGRVYGKVFADPVLDNGGTVLRTANSVSGVLSHECIEAWGDPQVNRWMEAPDGRLYADELCDPVEMDSYDVLVAGHPVAVSNFVCPSWFDDSPPAHAQFDYLRRLTAPFTMTKGGYMVYREAAAEQQTFGRVIAAFGEEYPEWRRPGKAHVAARTARRGAFLA
jgi:hypothetical protein